MNERTCIILAAGRGSRLGLSDRPKAMIGVYDRPLLHHTMQTVKSLNPDKTILVTGHMGHAIRDYFRGDAYYQEQKVLNGNAGALREGIKGTDNFDENLLVLQGDDSAFYTTHTFNHIFELHQNGQSDVTLLLTRDYNPDTFQTQYELKSSQRVSRLLYPIKRVSDGMFPTGSFLIKRSIAIDILATLHEINNVLSTTQIIMACLEKGKKVLSTTAPQSEWYGINTPKELSLSHLLMASHRGM